MSDPARSNPAARCFTRQHDVERVLKLLRESGDDGAMVDRGKDGGEKDGKQGRLINYISDCLAKNLMIGQFFIQIYRAPENDDIKSCAESNELAQSPSPEYTFLQQS